MDVGVSKCHLHSLTIIAIDPYIQRQLSSECPEDLGHLKVLFERVNMSLFFLKTTCGLPLGFFCQILIDSPDQHPNQTLATTWQQTAVRTLQ